MENRDRDKLNRDTESTEAGDVNRKVSSRRDKVEDFEDIEFGQSIGQSENKEPASRQGGGIGSSGMKGSTGSRRGSTGLGEGSTDLGDEAEGSDLESEIKRDR